MKKLLLGICYSLISQIVLSQSISGRVIDAQSGASIPSVTVELNNQSVTLTNEKGEFVISKLKPDKYHLRLSSIGYKTQEIMVSPSADPIIIKLETWNLFMQPVEVRATRASDQAPFAKTNISKKEIEKMNLGQDLPFLLNQTPSVVVNSDAGNGVGYTGIRIRGTDATRINMTINGIPYNDAESQGLFFVNLPDFASSVNNIQIQRGVGTSSNGAGAFGATMNFSTNEVNTSPYAEINNSYGSFNTWKNTVKAGSGLIDDHFTVDARLSHVTSDGYVDRASSNLSSAYLSAAWLSSKTSIRFNFLIGKEKTYQSWNGVSESDLKTNRTFNSAGTERPQGPYNNETDNYRQDHYQLFFNHQINKNTSFNTAFFFTKGNGYYEQYKAQQSYSDYGLPDYAIGTDTLTGTDLIRQLWLDNDFYGQVFSIQHKGNKNLLTFGGGWNRYDGNHFGKIVWATAGVPDNYIWYDHEAYKTDINLFGKYQQRITSSLETFVDLQYRSVLYNIDGFRNNPTVKVRETYDFVNPKIGITWFNDKYQVFGSWSVGQKEPNRDDFEAGQGQIPKPEKLNDFELGVERKSSQLKWGATFYYMRYKDQLVLTGKINDVGAYTRVNIPDSYRLGVELQASAYLNTWLNVAGNLTLSKNKVIDFTEYYDDYDNGGQKIVTHSNTDIALSPAVTGSAVVNIIPIKNLQISLPGKYVSQQYLDNTSNSARILNAFYVQDAQVSYSIKDFVAKEINLMFQVNNLFDKKYEPNGYTFSYQYGGDLITENYYFPMAGTNFMFAVNIKL
jgi:iron complex outermembrane receptor protein